MSFHLLGTPNSSLRQKWKECGSINRSKEEIPELSRIWGRVHLNNPKNDTSKTDKTLTEWAPMTLQNLLMDIGFPIGFSPTYSAVKELHVIKRNNSMGRSCHAKITE